MYQESWEDPPGNPREGIDSREQLRQTLQAVRDLLAQSGEQEAAYADLRRGKPLNYDQVRALLND
jgi:hypothetical protein